MFLRKVAPLVRERRTALGLSQARLARLAGLSRATVVQLESGTLDDLGVAKLDRLIGLLGLDLDAAVSKRKRGGLGAASRTSGVSYAKPMDSLELCDMLVSGELKADFVPHIATLLDEAPPAMIVAAVEDAARRTAMPARRIWRNLERWAIHLRSPRRIWA